MRLASLMVLALAVALTALLHLEPARALPPPTHWCGTVAGPDGARAHVDFTGWAAPRCRPVRQVAAAWVREPRRRIGPWRCQRFPHRREVTSDQVAGCRLGREAMAYISARRRSCRPVFRGPRPAVRVQVWGVERTRCSTARRLVAAFVRRPRVRRGAWTCHVPARPPVTNGTYLVGCRRAADAGVYGIA